MNQTDGRHIKLDQAKEMLDKLTRGRWTFNSEPIKIPDTTLQHWVMGDDFVDRPDGGWYGGICCFSADDAKFIAKSKDIISSLIATIESQNEEIEELKNRAKKDI